MLQVILFGIASMVACIFSMWNIIIDTDFVSIVMTFMFSIHGKDPDFIIRKLGGVFEKNQVILGFLVGVLQGDEQRVTLPVAQITN